jgi:hypothetical protein
MAAMRRCRISLTDADGVLHAVEVHGSTVYEVAPPASRSSETKAGSRHCRPPR